jgi:hypothetical protein
MMGRPAPHVIAAREVLNSTGVNASRAVRAADSTVSAAPS